MRIEGTTMVAQGGKTIAIVGGGFSGSLLAFHLLRRCGPHDRILLIERNRRFGLGLAYSTGNPSHLLNVRAGNMSAISSRPSHFVEWLRELPREELAALPEPPGPTGFVPRSLFGRYVQHLLGDRIWREGRSRHLDLVTDDVVALRRREAGGWEIELAMGRKLAADEAVLAIGHFPPSGSTPGYSGDPWDINALAGLPPDRAVLILGTGLTMIDTAVSLLDRRHRGPIYALSRRGLLPRVHLQTQGGALPAPWIFDEPPRTDSLVSLLRRVRGACREAEAQGRGWRVVIDGLRPHTQRIWRELSLPERARFLRHLRPWWDVHRHRAAPQIMERILRARDSGQLRLLTGRITGKDRRPSGFAVTVAPRGGQIPLSLTVDRIIDCSGPRTDCTKIDQPLLRQLLRDGLIRPDPLHLGIEVRPDGAVAARDGRPAPDLFAIGPITKGTFWEIIAVPDIRVACEQLAERLIPESLASPAAPSLETIGA